MKTIKPFHPQQSLPQQTPTAKLRWQKLPLALAIPLIAFASQNASADLLANATECIAKAPGVIYANAEGALAVAQFIADPNLGYCVSQIMLPDPLTIAGSTVIAGVVVNAGAKPSVKGSCEAAIRDAALQPLVERLSPITGLTFNKPPLTGTKQQVWDFLTNTPPSSLLWSKLSCGCTIFDKAAIAQDLQAVAKANIEAGQTCSKLLDDVIGGVLDAFSWAEDALESLIQGSPIPVTQYYGWRWIHFEQGYVYRALQRDDNPDKNPLLMTTPLPGNIPDDELGKAIEAVFGYRQTLPAGVPDVAPHQDKLREEAKGWYEKHQHSTSSAEARADELSTILRNRVDPKIVLARLYIAMRKDAELKKQEDIYWTNFANDDAVFPATKDALRAELDSWIVNSWKTLSLSSTHKPGDALLLVFTQHKTRLDSLKVQAETEIKQSKEEKFIAPLRRLIADSNLEKLNQLGGKQLCEKMHPKLKTSCITELASLQNAATKEVNQRKNTKISANDMADYGKSGPGGEQKTRDSKYTYALISDSKVPQQWVQVDFNALLNADKKIFSNYQKKIARLGEDYSLMQREFGLLVNNYRSKCPGTTINNIWFPNNECASGLSDTVAQCLVDVQLKTSQVGATPLTISPKAKDFTIQKPESLQFNKTTLNTAPTANTAKIRPELVKDLKVSDKLELSGRPDLTIPVKFLVHTCDVSIENYLATQKGKPAIAPATDTLKIASLLQTRLQKGQSALLSPPPQIQDHLLKHETLLKGQQLKLNLDKHATPALKTQ